MTMRQSQTAVLEKNTTLQGDFATEPFEVAWAREARWFFQIIESTGDPTADVSTQVSPDGLNWVDLPNGQRTIDGEPLTSWAVAEFGHWLRIRGRLPDGTTMKVRIYLALKS
jgi:hypothetical protein